MAGNYIYDPCFLPPNEPDPVHAACIEAPWDSSVTMLTLEGPLPKFNSFPHGSPWAVELSNTARCVIVTGTSTIVDGVPLSYVCQNPIGGAAQIVTTAQPWTARYAADLRSGPLQAEQVTTAWYSGNAPGTAG